MLMANLAIHISMFMLLLRTATDVERLYIVSRSALPD